MVKIISEAIGKDIAKKINEKGISKYSIYKNMENLTEPTLNKIIRGNYGNSLPLSVIVDIYRNIGENHILIKGSGFELFVKI